jgi:hypothetical protein
MQHEAQGISEQCPHGDPTCPCPDGDWCHHEDDPVTGTKAMRCPTPGHCEGISEQLSTPQKLIVAEALVRELTRELAELRATAEPRPSVGDEVTVTLAGTLTDYDSDAGIWTLVGSAVNRNSTRHVPWTWQLHWSTEFARPTPSQEEES